MPTIRERGKNQFQVIIRRRGFPVQTKTLPSKRLAEEWATLVESEMLRGVFFDRTEAERTTLGELLDRYLLEVTPTKRGAATSTEGSRVRVIKRDAIAQYKLTALSGKILAGYRDRRLQKVSGSTVNRELNMISHALNTARKEWGMECDNPIAYIRRPRENRGRDRRLNPGEEAAILTALEPGERNPDGTFSEGMHNPWIRPIVRLAIETAMRRGEILALRWENVHLERRAIVLPITKNGERRAVALSNCAVDILKGLPRTISGVVFPTTADAVKKAFSRACERAGTLRST